MRGLTPAELAFLLDSRVASEADLGTEGGEDENPTLLALAKDVMRRWLVEERHLLGPCQRSIEPRSVVDGEEDV